MGNWDSLRDQITKNMELKTTEELLLILEQNDREEWSDTAFEVVKKILIERTGEVPQIPAQNDERLGEPEHWESVDWKKVYRRSQKQLIQAKIGYVIAYIVSMLLLLLLYRTDQAIKTFVLLFSVGFLGWGLWFVIIEQKAKRLILEARIYLKQEPAPPFSERYSNWVEIVIQKAFTITSEGKISSVQEWMGHRKVKLSNRLYDYIEEQDNVHLLCLSNGKVLGEIEEYIDS
jgi:hypothetical protein